jgi:hypothetical protein
MKKQVLIVGIFVMLVVVGLVGCNEQINNQNDDENQYTEQERDRFTIKQTLSDKAQLNTIAFDCLAFLSGDLCSDSFLPPGKIADFFGFQYLRDNTAEGMGHNTDFVTRNSNNVLYILNDEQVAELVNLAKNQVDLINDYAYARFPIMAAFRRLLEGDIPHGSEGLDKNALMEYSAELYKLDGTISLQRAEVLGKVIRSMSQEQKDAFDQMAREGFQSWADLGDQVDKKSMSHDEHVAVMTYAGQLFSWYTGSVEADTYFCPERQGTYFGSFYLKDIPAMGNKGYTIDEELTGRSGESFLNILTNSQKEKITSLLDIQRNDLNEIVEKRREISEELRYYMTQDSIDEEQVLFFSESYGELDGEIVYYYSTHFVELDKILSSKQKEELISLRNLDDYPCKGAYLYSENIEMPEIINTDFLFGIGDVPTIVS